MTAKKPMTVEKFAKAIENTIKNPEDEKSLLNLLKDCSGKIMYKGEQHLEFRIERPDDPEVLVLIFKRPETNNKAPKLVSMFTVYAYTPEDDLSEEDMAIFLRYALLVKNQIEFAELFKNLKTIVK